MRSSGSTMVVAILTVLAVWAGILLSGCASTGEGKDAAPETESPRGIDKPGGALKETSGTGPEARMAAGAGRETSGAKPREAKRNADEARPRQKAGSLGHVLPASLLELDWNRIATPLGGIVALLLIWGLGFWLARLPHRRRGPSRRGGAGQTGEGAMGPVPR